VLEQIQATRASTSGKLQASDTFAQSSYVAWTTNQYTECCVLDSTRVYHTIPASGEGESGTHYDQTDFQYKSPQIMNWQKTPGGTITFKVFDARGNPTKVYVGTVDTGATVGDPTGGGAQGNNMVLVTENQYDGGNFGGVAGADDAKRLPLITSAPVGQIGCQIGSLGQYVSVPDDAGQCFRQGIVGHRGLIP